MPKKLKTAVVKNTGVKTKSGTDQVPATKIKAGVQDIDLSVFAHEQMTRYANSVNEDRAVPEYHDGFKPVQRRVLWAAYAGGYRVSKPVEKSARLVGDTLGKFHPHGDTACYGAIVNMVNMLYPLIEGEGNFGSFFDPKAAAMRYTNVRLSKFSERVFFDPFYMPMQKTVANYDDKDREPLHLLSLLPTVLFNTTFAIGVGLTARFPRFTLDSVVKLLGLVFEGQEPTAKLCAKTLVFTTQYRGILAPDQRAEVRELFETGAAKLKYDSVYTIDTQNRKIVFTGFAPFANFEVRAQRVIDSVAEVVRVANESERGEKVGRFAVYLKPRTEAKALPQLAEKIASYFSETESYFNNITVRAANKQDPDLANVVLRSTTVPELVAKWCAYRIKLEVGACTYQIELKDKEIRRLEVMRIAVAMRKAIIQALDKKLNDEELAKFLAKLLKVSVEEAGFILDLRVRQLKALEDQKLIDEIKKLKALRAGYVTRRDKPAAYCALHVRELLKELQ